MKMTSIFAGAGDRRRAVSGLARRWGAALFGAGDADAGCGAGGRCRLEMVLERDSVWRIGGRTAGVRIDCRRGRLWLTQAGGGADVILNPGQGFAAAGDGLIVVQPVGDVVEDEGGVAALGALTVGEEEGAARFGRGRAPVRARGLEPEPGLRRAGLWEEGAFVTLWLCGLAGVGYCLASVLSLP